MAENNFETKKSSKEIWLVLIFVDLIALCVFSYLIYNSFMNSDKKTVQINRNPKTEEVVLEEVDLSKPKQQEPKKEEIKETKKESLQKFEKEINKELTAEVTAQIKEEEKALPKKEPKEVKTQTETKTNVKNDVKKESIKISGSGKWRQVTFKYFDAAKSVAIVSGFTSTKPRDLKKINGVWEITLTISPGTYRYMFIVDGKEVKDPYNKQENNGRSLVTIK